MAAVLAETLTLDPEKEYETFQGIPEEKAMAGARHGRVGVRLTATLFNFIDAQNLGVVYGPDTTFRVGEDERLPDISFVSLARIPEDGDPEGLWEIAPDLAVEIVSPHDIYQKLMNKVFDYLDAGVKEVWLVAPESKTVTIYYSFTEVKILTEADTLTCEKLLPGFRCSVGDLFKLPQRSQE